MVHDAASVRICEGVVGHRLGRGHGVGVLAIARRLIRLQPSHCQQTLTLYKTLDTYKRVLAESHLEDEYLLIFASRSGASAAVVA